MLGSIWQHYQPGSSQALVCGVPVAYKWIFKGIHGDTGIFKGITGKQLGRLYGTQQGLLPLLHAPKLPNESNLPL